MQLLGENDALSYSLMTRPLRGVSLIDVIVGVFLVLVVFLTLFGMLRVSLLVSSVAKARAAATAVATSQMEFVRSLSYDAVGTVGGIPPGVVPQYATTTTDGSTFVTRTFIEYVDDEKDGLGAADTTGITTDYKRVKISTTYTLNNREREVALVSNVVPPGLETTTGGGTLKIDVVSAVGAPISGATVRVVNDALTPSVDVSTFSNVSGTVYLPGAATSTEYQVYVEKDGYSSAQTYVRDATNQNPTPGYLTVVKDQTTTGTFAIDTLATLTLRTYSPITSATSSDTFSGSGNVEGLANAAVVGGELTLSGAPGSYPSSGGARSTTTSPTYLSSWTSVGATLSAPPGTSVRVQVLDSAGALLPDAVLPGNSTGFTSFPVTLASVSTTTYPTLALGAELTSSDVMVAPSVLDWEIVYRAGPIPLPGVSLSLQGAKTIGSTGAGAPIYKSTIATTTSSTGVRSMSLEWDVYTLSVSGYDIEDACGAPPYTLSPGASSDNRLILGPATANALLVSVKDDVGANVPDASVTLSRTGYTSTVQTSACGTSYFGGVSGASYTITVEKAGYTTAVYTNVPVSGQTYYGAILD